MLENKRWACLTCFCIATRNSTEQSVHYNRKFKYDQSSWDDFWVLFCLWFPVLVNTNMLWQWCIGFFSVCNIYSFLSQPAISLCLGIFSLPPSPVPPSFCPPPYFISLCPLSSVAVCLSPSLLIVADYSRGLVRGHRQPSCSIWTCFLPRKPWPDETTHTHMRTHTQ